MAATDSRGENVRVAVLGTGIMGSAMARNLVSAGLRTTVWDRSPAATDPLSDAGALAAASSAEAVQDAHVVITMLPTAEVVNSVIFAGGVVEALAEGAVWAQMGTIGLTATTEIGSRLGQLRPDVLFVDAPVSGSKGPAKAGQLLILASGPPAAAAAVRPVFSAIGRKTVWLGQAGQGSRMKLAVNAYMSILIEGVAEALELAGWASMTPRWPRPSRAARWTRRSRTPSCTRWSAAISRRSSRWSGRSRTWTWRSGPPAMTSCRCWPRCPASGTQPLTPATAGKMSAPPASRSAATSSLNLPARSPRAAAD